MAFRTNNAINLSQAGIPSYNGTETFAGRTLTAGSTKISISNGDGIAGAPTIDAVEANFNLNNIGGTLGVAKGGTGQTTLTQYAVLVGNAASGIAQVGPGSAGYVLLGAGSANPSFVQPSTGTGLTLVSNATTLQYALTIPVAISSGGTGTTTAPTNGQLLIGNSGAYAVAALTAGSGINITNGAGSITISFAGGAGEVEDIIGTANQVLANGTTGVPQSGSVTLTLPQDIATSSNPTFNAPTFTGGGTSYGLSQTPSLTLGTQNVRAGAIKLLGVSATASDYGIIQQTTINLHLDCPNAAASGTWINNYAPLATTYIQRSGGFCSIAWGGNLYTLGMTNNTVDGSTFTPLIGLVNTGNPRYAVGFSTDHQTGVGQRLHFHVGDSGSNSTALTNAPAMTITAGQILSLGSVTPVNDTNLPLQMTTGGSNTNKYAGFNKAGAYGLLVGYANATALGTGGQIRMVATDPLYFYVNSTTLAGTINSSGKWMIGTSTSQADSLTNDLQLGVAGTTKGFSIAMTSTYIRMREVGTANQAALTTNYSISPTVQDNATLSSWVQYWYSAASNDYVQINRSPPGSVTLSALWQLDGSGLMRTGPVGIGYLSSTTGISSLARLNLLLNNATSDQGIFSTIYGATGINASDNVLFFRQARGTQASPTATQTGDYLGVVGWGGYRASQFDTASAFIYAVAADNFTSSALGTDLYFNTTPTGSNASVQRLLLSANGNVVVGSAALNTAATNGFLYIPTCAGAPSGVPTAYTGRVAMVFDSTNNRLYVYDGGWISVALA